MWKVEYAAPDFISCHLNQMRPPLFFYFYSPPSWLNASELQQDRCNGLRAAASSNGRHIWLMSALCCSPGESSRLSLGLLRAERTPFTALMMIDAVGSQLFLSGLHPLWSLTSGISEMNDLPLMEIRESACRGVRKRGRRKILHQGGNSSLAVTAIIPQHHFPCLE